MTFNELHPGDEFKLDENHREVYFRKFKGSIKWNAVRNDGAACHFDSRDNVMKIERNKWQPIETAPKDREILVQTVDDKIYRARWYESSFGNCFVCDDSYDYVLKYWMPLPEPFKE